MTSNGEKERDGASDTVVEAGSLTDLSRGVMKHRRKEGEDEVLRQRKRRGSSGEGGGRLVNERWVKAKFTPWHTTKG